MLRLIVILLYLGSFCQAQTVHGHKLEDAFTVGKTYYVFTAHTPLYKKADTASRVRMKLPVKTQVTVLEKGSDTLKISSEDTLWLKVKTSEGKEGYVHDIRLAIGHLTLQDGSALLYRRRYISGEKLIRFKQVTIDGRVVNMHAFDLDHPGLTLTLYDDRGLERIDHIITVDVFEESCDEPVKTSYLSLNIEKQELLIFGSILNQCSTDKTTITERLIFPNDCAGQGEKVIYVSEKRVLKNERSSLYESFIFKREHAWKFGSVYPFIERYNWNKF